MMFPLSSKEELLREYPQLPEEIELKYREWKVEEPRTRIATIGGHVFVLRPAPRRLIQHLDRAGLQYLDPSPVPHPEAPIISGLRGSPAVHPFDGRDISGQVSAFPKPEVAESQNILIWSSVLYPEYDIIRRMPNTVVMAALRVICGISGAGQEGMLYNHMMEDADSPEARHVLELCEAFRISPDTVESWTTEEFARYLALAHTLLILRNGPVEQPQQTPLPRHPRPAPGPSVGESRGKFSTPTPEPPPIDLNAKPQGKINFELENQKLMG